MSVHELREMDFTVSTQILFFQVKAHSAKAVGALWAVHHQASMAQFCKAATWSWVHTFTKFYEVDVKGYEDAAFGHIVLQAAV